MSHKYGTHASSVKQKQKRQIALTFVLETEFQVNSYKESP